MDKETIPSSGKTPQGVAVAQVDTQPGKKAVLSAADEEDLSMRAALYCILFQSFIDKVLSLSFQYQLCYDEWTQCWCSTSPWPLQRNGTMVCNSSEGVVVCIMHVCMCVCMYV